MTPPGWLTWGLRSIKHTVMPALIFITSAPTDRLHQGITTKNRNQPSALIALSYWGWSEPPSRAQVTPLPDLGDTVRQLARVHSHTYADFLIPNWPPHREDQKAPKALACLRLPSGALSRKVHSSPGAADRILDRQHVRGHIIESISKQTSW